MLVLVVDITTNLLDFARIAVLFFHFWYPLTNWSFYKYSNHSSASNSWQVPKIREFVFITKFVGNEACEACWSSGMILA